MGGKVREPTGLAFQLRENCVHSMGPSSASLTSHSESILLLCQVQTVDSRHHPGGFGARRQLWGTPDWFWRLGIYPDAREPGGAPEGHMTPGCALSSDDVGNTLTQSTSHDKILIRSFKIDEAFDKLGKAFTTALILMQFDSDNIIIMETTGCDYVLAEVMS